MMEVWCIRNQLSWKGTTNTQKIRCKFDRIVGNEDWHSIYVKSSVKYLELIGSDHRLILGDLIS